MSMHNFSINCKNDECEEEIEFEAELDPGEKASWGYYGGSPEVPPSLSCDEVICPKCGTDNTEKAQQYLDDCGFEQLRDDKPEPEPYDDY